MSQARKSSSNICCQACMCTSAVGVSTPSRSKSTASNRSSRGAAGVWSVTVAPILGGGSGRGDVERLARDLDLFIGRDDEHCDGGSVCRDARDLAALRRLVALVVDLDAREAEA